MRRVLLFFALFLALNFSFGQNSQAVVADSGNQEVVVCSQDSAVLDILSTALGKELFYGLASLALGDTLAASLRDSIVAITAQIVQAKQVSNLVAIDIEAYKVVLWHYLMKSWHLLEVRWLLEREGLAVFGDENHYRGFRCMKHWRINKDGRIGYFVRGMYTFYAHPFAVYWPPALDLIHAEDLTWFDVSGFQFGTPDALVINNTPNYWRNVNFPRRARYQALSLRREDLELVIWMREAIFSLAPNSISWTKPQQACMTALRFRYPKRESLECCIER